MASARSESASEHHSRSIMTSTRASVCNRAKWRESALCQAAWVRSSSSARRRLRQEPQPRPPGTPLAGGRRWRGWRTNPLLLPPLPQCRVCAAAPLGGGRRNSRLRARGGAVKRQRRWGSLRFRFGDDCVWWWPYFRFRGLVEMRAVWWDMGREQ